MHIPFVGIDRAALRGADVLVGRLRGIGGSWDSSGTGMMADVCIVRCGGD